MLLQISGREKLPEVLEVNLYNLRLITLCKLYLNKFKILIYFSINE